MTGKTTQKQGYKQFLKSKRLRQPAVGIEAKFLPDILFDFQAAIVKWACRKGRAAVFADCGLGKTFMQLAWIENMRKDSPALIVAPLGVVEQTIEEAARIELDVKYVKDGSSWKGIAITNYQRIHNFDDSDIAALVLDESSILKSIDGKTRSFLINHFAHVPSRLCCTATPAPNDLVELGNHSQFLGSMSVKEMQSMFFVNRAQTGTRWDMKPHGRESFYRWLASWAMFLRYPSDLGFDDGAFALPELSITDITIKSDSKPDGELFPRMRPGIGGRIEARKQTVDSRVSALSVLINKNGGQYLVWCGLNTEGRELHKQLESSVLVEGKDDSQEKIDSWHKWRDGEVRTLISKPSIFGFGMNFQHCNKMAFLGLGDSYEQYYQAIRRCWRFGQTQAVDVKIVTSNLEGAVVENVRNKERINRETIGRMVSAMSKYEQEELAGATETLAKSKGKTKRGDMWSVYGGDCIEWLSKAEENSIDLSIFSPPFLDLYAYTDSAKDIGNSRNAKEFYSHYGHVIDGLLKATKPGRICCTHVSQIPAIKYVDGFIGLKDFRGQMVEQYVDRGWIYHGEVVIDKDPQAQAIRTKSKGLLFVSLKRDASWLRPALADYVLVFKKPGENEVPVKPTDISHDDWISWARPIWYGINETKVLQFRAAKGENDTKHICPLQLDVIERCIKLWSNPGDMVFSPFAGIGSEGYMALKLGRKFSGCELKQEYFDLAVRNIPAGSNQLSLKLQGGS